MSAILAIETSHPRGSVAVVRDGVVLFEQTFTSERSHNSQLFAPLAKALEICSDDLSAMVVGLGPGSYTGARIGIAAAQGVALSRKVPVIGLPSVLAPETENLPHEFVVCGDARRGVFFIARVSAGTLATEITLHDSAELSQIRAADADSSWFTFDAKPPANLPDLILTAPSAACLAQIACRFSSEQIQSLANSPVLEPVYLSAPFITMPSSPLSP